MKRQGLIDYSNLNDSLNLLIRSAPPSLCAWKCIHNISLILIDNHVDQEELKKAYLASILRLGVSIAPTELEEDAETEDDQRKPTSSSTRPVKNRAGL